MLTLKQHLTLNLSFFLIVNPLLASDLQVDGTTNTTIDKARNNVPIVNIANPNSKGLSHNKFTNFNVNKEGLLLNNSRVNVNTKLSGYIAGNQNLSSTAKVILNEVTSTNRTRLNGYTEIAGQRADLVIANPNGITVNGAGFINTNNITLATGRPNILNGGISSFDINQGDITISGEGLDTKDQLSTYIYTTYLKLNAQTNAQNLDIKLGKNNIDYETKKILSSSDLTGSLLLDSSNLGGMYANRISLVGTSKGLGVNLPPEVLASMEDITITNDGLISLEKLTAKNDININSKNDSVSVNGSVYSQTNANISAKDTITNNSFILAKDSITLDSETLKNEDTILAGINSDKSLNDSGKIIISNVYTKNNGSITSTDNITLTANDFINTSELKTNNAIIKSETLENNANIIGLNSLNITSNDIISTSGEIKSNNLNIQTDTLNNTNTLIYGANDLIIDATKSITNNGTLQSNENLKITSKDLTNNETILGKSLNLITTNLFNNKELLATNYINIDTNLLDNKSKITSNKDIISKSSSFINDGEIYSGENGTITTDSFNNSKNITALNNLTIKSNDLTTTNGEVKANSLTIDSNILDNIDTAIYSKEDLNLTSTQNLKNSGTIESDKNIILKTDSLTNNKQILANNLDLTTTEITNNSELNAINNIIIYQNTKVDNSGNIEANNDITINSDNLTNNKIIKSKNINLTTKDLTNKDKIAASTYTINTDSLTNDLGAVITGISKGNITATKNINNSGKINSVDNLDVSAEDITNDGNFNSGANLTLTASNNLTNNKSLFASNNMNLYVTNTLQNNTNASIYAINNLTLAKNISNEKTKEINNKEASIETYAGDINIYADSFMNYTDNTPTVEGTVIDMNVYNTEHHWIEWCDNSINWGTCYKAIPITIKDIQGGEILYDFHKEIIGNKILFSENGIRIYSSVERDILTGNFIFAKKVVQQKLVGEVDNYASLYSGKDINIYADTFINQYSNITAKNNIYSKNNIFENKSVNLLKLSTSYELSFNSNSDKYYFYNQIKEYIPGASSTIQAGTKVTIDSTEIKNGNYKENQNISRESKKSKDIDNQSNSNINGTGIVIKSSTNGVTINSTDIDGDENYDEVTKDKSHQVNIKIPTDDYGLFVKAKASNSKYLIETNPDFTIYSNFISSDYILGKLDFDSELTTKRLGDDFYENKLIRESIQKQTGKTFLNKDISSDIEQYKYLMDNALSVQKDLKLQPGIALSNNQINSLTKDIIWMEEKVINGEKVLVPVVYIASAENLKVTGAKIIAGDDVSITSDALANTGLIDSNNDTKITVENDINNDGRIKANNNVKLKATNINTTGEIQSNNVDLKASNQINNILGKIEANNNLNLSAKNDITNLAGEIIANNITLSSEEGNIRNEVLEYSLGNYISSQNKVIGKQSVIDASNILDMTAKDIISIKASKINADKLNVNADTINIQAAQNTHTNGFLNKSNNVFSKVNTNNISLNSINDTNIKGANIVATEDMKVQAKNLNIEAVQDKYSFDSSSYTLKTTKNRKSSIDAKNMTLNADNLNMTSSDLNAKEDINLKGVSSVNILANNDSFYEKKVSHSSGFFSSKTKIDMKYKETVVSSNLNAKNIFMKSDGDINLEAVNINAKENKIADAGGNLNIYAKKYKEGELHQSSKSSWGGLVKSEYKYEKNNLKIKASEITAKNMILDAKQINIQASKIKADEANITTNILNLISSKESLYENEFSNKGGILTATIENKGKIKETIVPATIEVNNKLIFNQKDLTDQLSSDNLIKTLSSQGDLTAEQINLVKQVVNDKQWHTKTTTLSGLGSLIIQAIVTYFTAGAGTGLTVGITNAALKTAVQTAIQSMVTQATTQLVSGAITGNGLKLDLKAIAKGSITAAVLSYAGNLTNTKDFTAGLDKTTSEIAKTAINATVKAGVNSAINGTDFKNGLVNALLVDNAFKYIGHDLYNNPEYKDILPPKTITHAILGGSVAKLQGGDFVSGAISTAVAHVAAEAMIDNYMNDIANGTMSEDELINRTKLVSTITSGVISKIAKPNQSDKELSISNQIGQSNVENNSLKLITTAIKVARKLKKIKGKITKEKLKDIGLDEIADIIDDTSTVFSPDSSLAERAMAIADLTLGTNFVSKKTKVTSKIGLKPKETAKEFEKALFKLPPGEKVAKVKIKAEEVAKEHGLVKDKKISKKNNRDVYRDKDGNYYSVDTQHGRFEKTNSKGKHIDEYDFDFNSKGKTDKSGGHNLIVK